MQKKRWLQLVSGAAALLLVLTAVAWVVTPDRATPRPRAGTLSTAGAATGLNRVSRQAADEKPAGDGPIVIQPDHMDVSPPLRDIEPIVELPKEEALIRFREIGIIPGHEVEGSFSGVDSTLQSVQGPLAPMPSPAQNWDGINNGANSVRPPDTQGDVGLNHYVQWVNVRFQIWNKTGTSLYGPALGNTIWSGFGGQCQTANDGDPITLYDHLANRWVMMQFAVTSTPNLICIAVSQTADPTGSWYRYSYSWPSSYMPDYPKLGLWPDGYYLTVNQFTQAGSWVSGGVAAFERAKMLTGAAAQTIYYSLSSTYGGMLPADWEGATQPPSGAPCPFAEWDDSSWIGPSDALRIWNFHVDWTTPANSYFGASLAPNQTLVTADVDPTLCDASPACIDQPGTSVMLDDLADRLMHRLQYRNFGTYQTLVGNHTVDTNSPAGRAGIHWFELRNTGSGWSINQQGTYGPADTTSTSRWMGSIAMDSSGNMALGYSVTDNVSLYPSIRYAGRLATDTLGTLPQTETTLVTGGGNQTDSANRWGDYSAMQVDPVDDCTFWYTQEYAQTSGAYNWYTRIGSFKFPSCGTPDFTLDVTPATQDVCAGSSAAYTVNLASVGGFSSAVALTASGVPAPATATFVPASVTPTGSSTLTIGNTGGVTAGAYTIGVTGTSGALSHSANVTLNVSAALAAGPTLTAPADGSTGIATTPTFTWGAVTGAASYTLQVATDPAFGSLVINQSGLTATSYTPGSALTGDTVYYWRVTAVNGCGSKVSSIDAFRTAGGTTCMDVIGDGSFEAGRPNPLWSESSSGGYAIIYQDNAVARTGSWLAWMGYFASENSQVWQAPAISASATSASLTYWYQIDSGDLCNYDYGYFKVAGSTKTTYNLCSSTDTGGAYVQATYNMLAYKGTSPEVRFQVTTDSSIASSLLIDDVALNVCTGSTSTTGDYSDLASGYGIAWHTGNGSVKLGSGWDSDTLFSAASDDTTDDGVMRNYSESWNDARGEVNVTVNGTAGQYACLNAWLDYSDGAVVAGTPDTPNGVFDANEHVVVNQPLLPGTSQVTWPLAIGVINGNASYNIRFRLVPAPTLTDPNSCSGVTLVAADSRPAGDGALAPDGGADLTGSAAGGEVEDYTFNAGPLAVDLAGFSAETSIDGVTLAWETVSETDNAGFNIDRADSEAGPWTRLNAALIPAATPGSSQGHIYTWVDPTAQPNTGYVYRLEAVALDGTVEVLDTLGVTYRPAQRRWLPMAR